MTKDRNWPATGPSTETGSPAFEEVENCSGEHAAWHRRRYTSGATCHCAM